MSIRSKGTKIYFIDPSDDATVITVGCPQSLGSLGGKRAATSEACLGADEKTTSLGAIEYSGATIPVLLDPSDTSHKKIYDAFKSGASDIWFAVGLSDGTDAPTVTTGAWTIPTTRTFITFKGGVSDWSIGAEVDSSVKNNVTVQVCSDFAISWKA